MSNQPARRPTPHLILPRSAWPIKLAVAVATDLQSAADATHLLEAELAARKDVREAPRRSAIRIVTFEAALARAILVDELRMDLEVVAGTLTTAEAAARAHGDLARLVIAWCEVEPRRSPFLLN